LDWLYIITFIKKVCIIYNWSIFWQTILAHGVHLENSELAILKQRGTAVIHCPSSNTNLKSGLCDVQRLRAKNIKIGLGTGITKLFYKNFISRMIFWYNITTC